ncbi:galectin-7-like isoform X2 [Photinus pyralis]|uniref:Galectin n=1 Tax=Photinus pyralis TaxID=7054 RepID=A0A1Y1MES7_PHOPY|nr:galectin-7-like isoform X2 [Photinus pyralis]
MEQPIIDPPIPLVGPIGGRFSPGKVIRIKGAVPSIANRFDINLQCGPQTAPRDDIVLQIAVRILDGFIALNSLQNGIWDDELKGHTQPIKRADHFEMVIVCDFNKFMVSINDQLVCDYPQRIHYDRITHLVIEGEVTVAEISDGSQASGKPPSYSEVVNVPPYPQDLSATSPPTHNSATVTVTSDSSPTAPELIPLTGAELNAPLSKPVEDILSGNYDWNYYRWTFCKVN